MSALVFTPYQQVLGLYGMRLNRADFMDWNEKKQQGQKQPDVDVDEAIETVSRESHTRILWQPKGVLVEDCRSKSATFLNGMYLKRPIEITWNELPRTTIYLGKPCFCVRFLPLTELVELNQQGKPMRSLPIGNEPRVFMMYLGFYKHTIRRAYIQVEPTQSLEADHGETIAPGTGGSVIQNGSGL
jgi:hypothetical protein